MSTVESPWEVSPALEPGRLVTLARIAVEARQSAVADARRDEGDTNWGIGCRAYERFIHRVTAAATSGSHPWLRLRRDGLSLTIAIEGVLIRAYTGRADKPDMRHVLAAQTEVEPRDDRQLALPFLGDDDADDGSWVWLMAVETDAEGRATQVTFFQASAAGETRHAWDAPMAAILPPPERPAAPPARKARRAPEPRRVSTTASLFD